MTVVELRQARSRFRLGDVRSPSEIAAGHIPFTVNIPMEQIGARVGDLDQDLRVVLICKSGTRARGEFLGSRAPRLSVLDGGTEAWEERGLPLVQSHACRWSLERQVGLGAGISFAAATDICGVGILLSKMPWNRR